MHTLIQVLLAGEGLELGQQVAVYPGFRLKVGSISDATGKGRHTTTRAELMPLPYGGFVVDTPGLREFAVLDLASDVLIAAFSEIAAVTGCPPTWALVGMRGRFPSISP